MSTYQGYSYQLKAIAAIPAVFAILLFIYIIHKQAGSESETETMVKNWLADKFTKKRKPRIKPLYEESEAGGDEELPAIEKHTSTPFSYYFQHPYPRLCLAYLHVFLSWYLIAEDPIAHSRSPAKMDILGNDFMLLFGRYPEQPEFSMLKVVSWMLAFLSSIFIGKFIVHQFLCNGILKVKLFDKGQGSWLVMFATFTLMLYAWSLVYTAVISTRPELQAYAITNRMQITFTTFMKGVALVSFFGHFILVLMITDTMLQESHYPNWVPAVRRTWRKAWVRITVVWSVALSVTVVAVIAITIDLIGWEHMGAVLPVSNELGRCVLAAFIVFFDFLILMQDWEFPRFYVNEKINLPGLPVANFHIKFCCVDLHLKGKWFTYGLILIVFMVDIYNLKNQLNYVPLDYEQYVGEDNYIYTIVNETLFMRNETLMKKALSLYLPPHVLRLNNQFKGYDTDEKQAASILWVVLGAVGFIVFGVKRHFEMGRNS